jgi:L-threonylcarbamoyladenylate synthase
MPHPDDHARVTDRIGEAVTVLRNGGLVGIPTETVYGLAADASNEAAVRRIFAAKHRPNDHPLIVHIASIEAMAAWSKSIPDTARVLAEACWPGPLSVLVPRATHVLDVVTGGRDTVALRVPAHPMALELLQRFGGGLAAPSANRFGQVSPTTAAHVRADLGDAVDLVLDGGPCPIGVESTIVDCTCSPPQVLRPGGIPNETVSRLLDGVLAASSGSSRASGMLVSHYAPRCRVEIVNSLAEAEARASTHQRAGRKVDTLDPTQDLVAAAQQLYVWLRDADSRELDVLVAVLPPAEGLGHAIRDRLTKAAGGGDIASVS